LANLHSFVVCALQSTRIGLPGPENGSLFRSCEILRVHNLHRVREDAGAMGSLANHLEQIGGSPSDKLCEAHRRNPLRRARPVKSVWINAC